MDPIIFSLISPRSARIMESISAALARLVWPLTGHELTTIGSSCFFAKPATSASLVYKRGRISVIPVRLR